jgi:hypothetical protein
VFPLLPIPLPDPNSISFWFVKPLPFKSLTTGVQVREANACFYSNDEMKPCWLSFPLNSTHNDEYLSGGKKTVSHGESLRVGKGVVGTHMHVCTHMCVRWCTHTAYVCMYRRTCVHTRTWYMHRYTCAHTRVCTQHVSMHVHTCMECTWLHTWMCTMCPRVHAHTAHTMHVCT